MATLLNRSHDFSRSEQHLLRALPLAYVTGDIRLFCAILFNLAHTRFMMLQAGLTSDPSQVFELVDIECAVRTALNIGRDSIQTELIGADLAARLKNASLCEAYLKQAADIVEKAQTSQYDQGCYHRARAKFLWITVEDGEERRKRAARELRIAIGIFKSIDLEPAVVLQEIRMVDAGQGPFGDVSGGAGPA
jgi:hypothetical protein